MLTITTNQLSAHNHSLLEPGVHEQQLAQLRRARICGGVSVLGTVLRRWRLRELAAVLVSWQLGQSAAKADSKAEILVTTRSLLARFVFSRLVGQGMGLAVNVRQELHLRLLELGPFLTLRM